MYKALPIPHQLIAISSGGKMAGVAGVVGIVLLVLILFFTLRWYKTTKRRFAAALHNARIKNDLLISQNKDLLERITGMEGSLKHASRIQQAIFPDENHIRHYFPNSFLLHLPSDIISGDFCWIKSVGNKKIVAVGDCTGHGFPGAYISSMVYHCLEKIVADYGITQLDLLMEELNFYFLETFKYHKKAIIDEGIDIALAAFTEEEDVMEFCGARNGFLLVREGIATPVKASSTGINTKYEYKDIYYSSHHKIVPGDMLYFFSDGYKDQFGGPKGKKYQTRQLHNFLTKLAAEPVMNHQRTALLHEFKTWQGNEPQVDDVIVLGIRI